MKSYKSIFILLLTLFSLLIVLVSTSYADGWGSASAPKKNPVKELIKTSHYIKPFLKNKFCLDKYRFDKDQQLACLKMIADLAIPDNQMWSCNKRYRKVSDQAIIKCLKRVGTPLKRIRKSLTYAKNYSYSAYRAKRKGVSSSVINSKLRKAKYFLNGALTLFPKDRFYKVRTLLKKAKYTHLRWGNSYKAWQALRDALKLFQVHKSKKIKKKKRTTVKVPPLRIGPQKAPDKEVTPPKRLRYCKGDCWYERNYIDRGLKKRPAVWMQFGGQIVVDFLYKSGKRYRLGITPIMTRKHRNPVLDIDCESDYQRIGIDKSGKIMRDHLGRVLDTFSDGKMRFILNPRTSYNKGPGTVPISLENVETVSFNLDKRGGFILPSHINRATTPHLCMWIKTGVRQYERDFASIVGAVPTMLVMFMLRSGTDFAMRMPSMGSRVSTINRLISKRRGNFNDWVKKWNIKNPGNRFTRNLDIAGKQRYKRLDGLTGGNRRAVVRYYKKTVKYIAKEEAKASKLKKAKKARKTEWGKKLVAREKKVTDAAITKWSGKAKKVMKEVEKLQNKVAKLEKPLARARKYGNRRLQKYYERMINRYTKKANRLTKKAKKYQQKVINSRLTTEGRAHYLKTKEALYQNCQKISSKSTKLALKTFSKYVITTKLTLELSMYVLTHLQDKHSRSRWWAELGYNFILGYFAGLIPGRVVGGVGGGPVVQGATVFAAELGVDYFNTRGYQMAFGVSEDEASKKVKELMKRKEWREAIKKLHKFIVKIMKTAEYRKLRNRYIVATGGKGLRYSKITRQDLKDPKLMELLKKAYAKKRYYQQSGLWKTGSLANDRYYFNIIFGGSVAIPRAWIFRQTLQAICMGNPPSVAMYYFSSQLILNATYYISRKVIINQ